ncbi:FAD-binding monooxygenase [Methylorubrum extorquens]|uniref:FAD-dependent monooxygenase n=1 Tax=Methylorubrum extorquens TaxID=408 RepID=UPI00116B1643|nr:FAD-dependent monooxygenase [Methylorubrum extorquens]GEL43527.1 FAD-binding monooxygenase [Methylorubrum extorquens]
MKISCVGAGPAGLYFAIVMKRRNPNHEIVVHERNPAGTTHGWGVVFWEDLLATLRTNDPDSAQAIADQAVPWSGQVVDVEGQPPLHHGGGGYGLCRRRLLQILVERALALGVDVRFESEISELSQVADADLVVAADGVASPLRRHRADQFRPQIEAGRNKYLWLATTQRFSSFKFGFVPTSAGWVWFHAYSFKEGMSTFIVECAPETWKGLGLGTMRADAELRLLESIFAKHLDGHELISRDGQGHTLPWSSFRRLVNRRWRADNLVLIGDAAHTTHFTIGSGTRLAIDDAIALASALSEHDSLPRALDAFDRRRQRALARVQRDARLSAEWFENIPRYIRYNAPTFFTLLLARRSRLLKRIPARTYLYLRGQYTKLTGRAAAPLGRIGGPAHPFGSRAKCGIAGAEPGAPRH